MRCDQAREDAAAFVLGDLDGAGRAVVIEHLSQCPPCQSEVASLTVAVDGLSRLAPPLPPSEGFVDRVVAGLPPPPAAAPPLGAGVPEVGQVQTHRRPVLAPRGAHRRARGQRTGPRAGHRAYVAAAAAVVVVAGAVAYTALDRRPARTAPQAPVAATDLRTPTGDKVGQAVMFLQPKPYMSVSVDLPASLYDRVSGPYLVTVVGRGGADVAQGQMGVLDGRGALNEPLKAVGDVVDVRVAAPNGVDLCSGPFGPGAGKGGPPPRMPPPGAYRVVRAWAASAASQYSANAASGASRDRPRSVSS